MTLEERIETAAELRRAGYNCASSVLLCFPDITGMSREEATKVTNALGSGIGGCREICGAATAMAMLAGFKSAPSASSKAEASKLANGCLKEFADANSGCLRCAQLKDRQTQGRAVRSCNELVAQCVAIAHHRIAK